MTPQFPKLPGQLRDNCDTAFHVLVYPGRVKPSPPSYEILFALEGPKPARFPSDTHAGRLPYSIMRCQCLPSRSSVDLSFELPASRLTLLANATDYQLEQQSLVWIKPMPYVRFCRNYFEALEHDSRTRIPENDVRLEPSAMGEADQLRPLPLVK